ncbi:MAG TPA: glycosyltransferase [Verrucomicrobiae bacterium]|nr:glycosyltransferase [Verrucomicrobiae bacterium]
MRILHTEWSDGWGGQEIRVINEMEGMARRGHEVILATRPNCQISEVARRRGIEVVHLPMRSPLDVRSIFQLRRVLRAKNIEIVNTHSGIDSWIGGIAARIAGAPLLLRTRHLNIPLKRSPINFVHSLPDAIITCGEAIRKELIERDGFAPERLVNIATGIDFNRFTPTRSRAEVRETLDLPSGAFVVLMIGILRGVKGHEIALQAMALLAKEFPEVVLLLAGNGPMESYLRDKAIAFGVAGRIYFLGFRDDIPDLMAAADMLLLTSKSEGVPQSVTQALGFGLPVVATRVGGVTELIEHERTGILVPPGDPAAVSEAIRSVVEDPQKARARAAAGKAHARANFSLDLMLEKTERLYSEMPRQKKRFHK